MDTLEPSYDWDALVASHEAQLKEIYGNFENSAFPWEIRKALGAEAAELKTGQREFYLAEDRSVRESVAKQNFEELEERLKDEALRKRWHAHVKKWGAKKAYVDASDRMTKEIALGRKPPQKSSPAEVVAAPPAAAAAAAAPPADSAQAPNQLKRTSSVASIPYYRPGPDYDDYITRESARRSAEYYNAACGKSKTVASQSIWAGKSHLPRYRIADAIVKRARGLGDPE